MSLQLWSAATFFSKRTVIMSSWPIDDQFTTGVLAFGNRKVKEPQVTSGRNRFMSPRPTAIKTPEHVAGHAFEPFRSF